MHEHESVAGVALRAEMIMDGKWLKGCAFWVSCESERTPAPTTSLLARPKFSILNTFWQKLRGAAPLQDFRTEESESLSKC